MSDKQTTESILFNLQHALKTAKFGLDDLLSNDPARRSAGLLNLTVWGRAVTNVLQNLKSTEPAFESWYKPIQEEMTGDELMRFFYKRRSEHLKRGQIGVSRVVKNLQFNPQEFHERFPPPPNAKRMFMGDENGGAGWEVEMPDGSVEKIYINLPPEIGQTSIEFGSPPTTHIGKPVEDTSVGNLAKLYYRYIEQLVNKAVGKFGSNPSNQKTNLKVV